MIEVKLPNGWIWTTLGDVRVHKTSSIAPKKYPNEMFELYSVPSYENKSPEILAGKEIGSNKQIVEEGTVLLCKINPRINRVWIVGNFSPHMKIASTEWILFPQLASLHPRYLMFFCQTPHFREFLKMNVSGVGGSLMRISANKIADFPFPLSPFAEQHRIVEKLEELFTKLDAGVEELKQAKERIKQYRQSVLTHAFTGKFTEKWREEHKGELEPASELLTDILKKRRQKWETDYFAKLEAQGKKPKDEKWKMTYKEPSFVDATKTLQVPKGWVVASLSQVSWDSGYGTSVKCGYKYNGPPVLRIPNIIKETIDLNDMKMASDESKLATIHPLSQGDMLIVRTNGSRNLIGRSAVIEKDYDIEYYYASYLIRFRILPFEPLYKWINFLWASPRVRYWIENRASTSAGQYNISMTILERAPIELPPLEEQKLIISEIERHFSIADKSEQAIEQSLKQAETLRQSILKKAFEGLLVPQNPDDEPATVLLEHIKKEKEALAKRKIRIRPVKGKIVLREKLDIEKLMREVAIMGNLYAVLSMFPERRTTPKELWQKSGLDIDTFYASLKEQVESGQIIEHRPNEKDVYLEAIQ